MKNIFRHKHIFTAFLFSLLFSTFSCNNIAEISDVSDESANSKACIVRFTVSDEDSRALTTRVYKLTDLAYSLVGKLNDNTGISGRWDSYEDMRKASFTMRTGTWTFKMYAYVKEEINGKVTVSKDPMLYSEISQEITEGSNRLAFTMKTCETGFGSFAMELTFNNTVSAVEATLCKFNGDALNEEEPELDLGERYDSETCGLITQTWSGDKLSEGHVTYEIKNIKKGSYRLRIKLTEGSGDDAKETYLNQLASVVPGTSSTRSVDISDNSESLKKYYAVYYYSGVEDEEESKKITVPVDNNFYQVGNTINLVFPSEDDTELLKREGWEFTGWKNTNTGAVYSKEGTAKLTVLDEELEKISLVAQWVREGNKAVIFYHGNGGTAIMNDGEKVDVYEQIEEKNTDEPIRLWLNKFTREGYLFTGWAYNDTATEPTLEESAQLTLTADDTHLYAVWQPQYVVKYMLQNTEDDGYTEDKRETKCGKAGETVDVTKNASLYKGFTLVDFELPEIAADGSTVVEIKYNRNVHTVSYSAGEVDEGDRITLPAAKTYRYGSTVTITDDDTATREGYTFVGWLYNNTSLKVGGSISMPDEDITLAASWDAAEGTAYTVEHYLQKLDAGTTFLASDYVLQDKDTVNRIGKTNALTNAAALNYKGYSNGFTEGKEPGTSEPIEQQTIAADGSTVVKIYYNRNLYTVNYVENLPEKLNSDAEKGEIIIPEPVQYRYEAPVPYVAAVIPEDDGYEFLGWSSIQSYSEPEYTKDGEKELKIGTDNVTLYAVWKAKDISYTIQYYKQKLDSEISTDFIESDYLLDSAATATESAKAWTRTEIAAAADKFTGYSHRKTVDIEINPHVENVVKIYYNLRTAKVIYNANGEAGLAKPDTADYRYGAEVTVNFSNPVMSRPGYEFRGWAKTSDASTPDYYEASEGKDGVTSLYMGLEDVILYAVWSEGLNTPYSVEHLHQKVTLDGYESNANYTETKTGRTKSLTDARARMDTGFGNGFTEGMEPGTIEQQAINAAGNTVVKIYYNRNIHTVTYDDGVESETIDVPTSKDYPYGASVDLTTVPTRTGYTFVGWMNGETLETKSLPMPDKDINLVAKWEPNTGTNYTVEHYRQNLDAGDTFNPSDYSIVSDDTTTHKGTTNALTEASPRSYPGFTARTFSQETIAANDSTVIKIYYDRNMHSVSYDFNGAGTDMDELTPIPAKQYRYEDTVTVDFPDELLSFAGYDFYGWSIAPKEVNENRTENDARYKKNGSDSFTMYDSAVTLYAVWKPKSDVEYTVEHKGQELDPTTNEPKKDENGNYIYYVIETVIQKGQTGKDTSAVPVTITGFTKETVENKPISRTGDTVVEYKYTRNSYTFTYDLNMPEAMKKDKNKGDITPSEDGNYYYGSTIVKPSITYQGDIGYTFEGWTTNKDSTDVQYPAGDDITVNENLVEGKENGSEIIFYAIWKPVENVPYTIEYYLRNVDDTQYDGYQTVEKTGTVWTTIVPEAIDITGAKIESGKTENVVLNPHKTAEENVAKVYYDRESYTLTYDANANGESGIYAPTNREARYGKEFELDFAAMDLNSEGRKNRPGYDFKGWATSANASKADYYEASDGNDGKISYTMGDSDVTLYAVWEARSDTSYTVKHYQQKLKAKANFDQDDYELVSLDTTELTGKTADNTVAVENSYPGFTEGFTVGNEPGTITQEKIAGNGNTVIRIYYNRKTYTLHYDVNATADWDGTSASVPADSSDSYRFGATVTPSYEMGGKRTGYSFMGWDTEKTATEASYKKADETSFVIDGDIYSKADSSNVLTLYAVWTANAVSGSSGGIDITTPEYPESGNDKELIQSTVVAEDGNSVTFTVKTWGFNQCIYKWYVNGEDAGSIDCRGDTPVISGGCNFSAPSEPGEDGFVTITWDTSSLGADRYDLSLTLTGYDNTELERHSQQTYINIEK